MTTFLQLTETLQARIEAGAIRNAEFNELKWYAQSRHEEMMERDLIAATDVYLQADYDRQPCDEDLTGMSLNAEVKGLFFDMHFAKGSIAAILYGVFYYIGRRISGANLNPVVSFGMVYTNQLKIGEVS